MNFKKGLKNTLHNMGYELRQVKKSDSNAIHFLHIGKCAGTQIGRIIKQINAAEGKNKIVKHGHDTFLRDLPEQARFFFSIRHPLSRFVSGFYSRKRKGQPRTYVEWNNYEEYAFTHFKEANELAESLFEDGLPGRQAAAAMKSIRHTAQNQSDWFYGCGALLFVREPIWIIRQEKFDFDLEKFLRAAGFEHLSGQIKIEQDSVKSHVADYSGIPQLSEKAKANLNVWYAQDVEFYKMCESWLNERIK